MEIHLSESPRSKLRGINLIKRELILHYRLLIIAAILYFPLDNVFASAAIQARQQAVQQQRQAVLQQQQATIQAQQQAYRQALLSRQSQAQQQAVNQALSARAAQQQVYQQLRQP